ncbi:response regulator transcription factor [Nostoc ellipsosporum NOK]|nr:response regulator transcription factor [Nostoc ellipsosporum NOK]
MTSVRPISKVNILIGDKDPIYREGLGLILNKVRTFNVVDYVENGKDIVNIVRDRQIDVVITDVDLPSLNGIDATRQIRLFNSSTKILCFSHLQDQDTITDMMDAGANGYLAKSSPKTDLFTSIQHIRNGRVFFCDQTSNRITSILAAGKNLSRKTEELARFNKNELEIIKLICLQRASKEIACVTHLAHRTVEKYRERIMEKTGTQNMVGIALYAVRNGIFRL